MEIVNTSRKVVSDEIFCHGNVCNEYMFIRIRFFLLLTSKHQQQYELIAAICCYMYFLMEYRKIGQLNISVNHIILLQNGFVDSRLQMDFTDRKEALFIKYLEKKRSNGLLIFSIKDLSFILVKRNNFLNYIGINLFLFHMFAFC